MWKKEREGKCVYIYIHYIYTTMYIYCYILPLYVCVCVYIYIYMEERNLERVSVYPPGSHGCFQVVLVVKNLPANSGDARDSGSVPGLGRSPEERNGNPLQYSCLMNPMVIGAWWVISPMGLQRVGHD